MNKTLILVLCLFFEIYAEENVEFLDYAASWQVSDESLAEFVRISHMNGNSSGINPHAKCLKDLEKQSAQIIAEKIGTIQQEQIHFTSGATAANNIAILGVAYKNPKCHLIASKIEHKSVLNVFKYLEKIGYEVTYLDVDKSGKINLEQLKRSIHKNTKLISIQMFNSEIGVLQDIEEIGKIAKSHNVIFHCDAAQSFCKYDINVERMNIDLLTISGHKIGTPKGIGALYIRNDEALQPIMFGSGDKFFPGTKSTALIKAFATAVQSYKVDMDRILSKYAAFVAEISKIPGIFINSSPSHVISLSIEGVLLRDLLDCLPQYSFSAGCSCLGQDKSNVIAAIDPQNQLPTCTIRISFSNSISQEKLLRFANKLRTTIEQLRKEKKIGKGCESDITEEKQQDLNHSLEKIKQLVEVAGRKKV